MYDRIPLKIIENTPNEGICLGRCFILSLKSDQILGLLLQETDTEYVIGYPSKCFLGEDESGESVYEMVPYTKLPVIRVAKTSAPVTVPLHAESEYSFYEYLVNNISESKDFSHILESYGYDANKSTEYYLQRYFKIKKYCDKVDSEHTYHKVDTIH